jgi:hypothetical protein
MRTKVLEYFKFNERKSFIQSGVLILRQTQVEDSPAIFEYFSDAFMRRSLWKVLDVHCFFIDFGLKLRISSQELIFPLHFGLLFVELQYFRF